MAFNPYPTAADLRREHDAEARDVADLVTLRELRGIVRDAIARAGRFDRIHHPDARWSTGEDLLDALQTSTRLRTVAITAIPGAPPCTT